MSKKYSVASQSSKLSKKSKSHSSKSSQYNDSEKDSSQKSGSAVQHKVMQEAIQKASCLIELLTRQNSQLKLAVQQANDRLSQANQKLSLMESQNQELKQKLIQLQQSNQQIQKQNQDLLFQLQKQKLLIQQEIDTKLQLQESKQGKRKLHEKLAYQTSKISQLSKQLQKTRKQHKSLQNENMYLLKQLKKSQDKQNQFNENILIKENEFHERMQDLDRTKNAFARRVDQLKQQNFNLFYELERVQREKRQIQLISSESMATVDVLTRKMQCYRFLEDTIHKLYDRVKLSGQKRKDQILIPYREISIKEKLEQLQMLITYRLQHIETLTQQISDKLSHSQWKQNLRSLGQVQILVQRLSSYMTELSN